MAMGAMMAGAQKQSPPSVSSMPARSMPVAVTPQQPDFGSAGPAGPTSAQPGTVPEIVLLPDVAIDDAPSTSAPTASHRLRPWAALLMACASAAALGGSAEARTLEGQDQESRYLSDRFHLSVGWFGADFSTDAAVGFGNVLGTFIRFEDELGIEDDKDSLRMLGHWRFNRRHALTYGFLRLDRSGTQTIDEAIDFENLRFTGTIDTRFDQDLINLGYRYSFYNNGKIEAAAGAGLSVYRFTIGLSGMAELLVSTGQPVAGSGQFGSEEEKLTAPVPTFGISLHYAITPKVIFRYQAGGSTSTRPTTRSASPTTPARSSGTSTATSASAEG